MAESKRKNANAESSEDSENPENSELEVMREKIRKLEAKLAMKEKELMSYQIDHLEAKENEVVDIILVFMNNNGFKGIADKILSFLDCKSFVQCRLVCRSWKNFIDNEWSMLQRQIFHLKRHVDINSIRPLFWSIDDGEDEGVEEVEDSSANEEDDDQEHEEEANDEENADEDDNYEEDDDDDDNDKPIWHIDGDPDHFFNPGPVFKIMEKNTNKSELRVFINMCRELLSRSCCHNFPEEDLLKFMIDHHHHQELEMFLNFPIQKKQNQKLYFNEKVTDVLETAFNYACTDGCEICVNCFTKTRNNLKTCQVVLL